MQYLLWISVNASFTLTYNYCAQGVQFVLWKSKRFKMSSLTLPKSGWLCASRTCCWSSSFSWRRIGWLCWRSAFCSKNAKQPHSHVHPRCSQVLSKLYPSCLRCPKCFHSRMNWRRKLKIMRISALDPQSTHWPTCISLYFSSVWRARAFASCFARQFGDSVVCIFVIGGTASHVVGFRYSKSKQMKKKWKHLPPPVQLASQHSQQPSAVEALVPSYKMTSNIFCEC